MITRNEPVGPIYRRPLQRGMEPRYGRTQTTVLVLESDTLLTLLTARLDTRHVSPTRLRTVSCAISTLHFLTLRWFL